MPVRPPFRTPDRCNDDPWVSRCTGFESQGRGEDRGHAGVWRLRVVMEWNKS